MILLGGDIDPAIDQIIATVKEAEKHVPKSRYRPNRKPYRSIKSCRPLTLKVSLEGIVCYSHTFDNNL